MTKAERALLWAAIAWSLPQLPAGFCKRRDCEDCRVLRAARRVLAERKKGGKK